MSSGATFRWVSTPRTSRAIPPCRTRWSTTSPTMRCRFWPTRSDTETTRVCSATVRWGTDTTTTGSSGRCGRSTTTGRSSNPSTRRRARTSRPRRDSTKGRPGTTPSSCRTTWRGWRNSWEAGGSSSTSSKWSSTRGCTTLRTNPTSPTPTYSAAFRARSGARSARCAVCWTPALRPPRTVFRATTTRVRCRPGPSSR